MGLPFKTVSSQTSSTFTIHLGWISFIVCICSILSSIVILNTLGKTDEISMVNDSSGKEILSLKMLTFNKLNLLITVAYAHLI